mmetsp:Transcript_14409/g.23803  ORF Transcript_14409/g.23803 Transcript_14409/m.23803 type:complete len:523 (-) Transcript_14409:19-1587(-)
MKAPVTIAITVVCGVLVVFQLVMGNKSMSSLCSSNPFFADTATGTSTTNDLQGIIKDMHQRRQTLAGPVSKKPLNVIILYPDDMRHDSLSSAGTQLVQTPFLDELANLGKRFTHNCVTTSICWISRATLFSGKYLSRHKSHSLGNPMFCGEDTWNQTWPYLLQQHGYYVGHIGKWQFKNFGFVAKAFNWTRLFEGKHWHNINGKKTHTTDHTENSTIQFLRERPKDTPFAVTVAFYPPKGISGPDFRYFNPKPESNHLYANVTIPEAFDLNASFHRLPRKVFTDKNIGRETWWYSFGTHERHQNNMKDMYRMITEVDAACGNIVNELKEQGILDDTLVIFTTDNGMLHGEHGLGGKWYPYQESIRVPLIVWDPRMPEATRGKLDDAFTLNIDLAPTILGAAQIGQPAGMQGRDIADLYLRENQHASWRTEFYYEHPTHQGEAKIPKSSALVRKDFKYIRYDNFNIESLFHLEMDQMELNNVLENPIYEKKLAEMRIRYEELKQEAAEPAPHNYSRIKYKGLA